MHCIVSVRVHGLYVGCRGEAREKPLVIHRDRFVLDASPLAISHGVAIGQSLSEARTILGSQGRFIVWERSAYEQAQTRFLDVCASYSDLVEPRDQHTALIDLSEHPDPKGTASALREEVSQVTGLDVTVGLGGCRWIAELACGTGDQSDLPLVTPRRFISPMTTRVLPIPATDSERLVALGYPTVGAVARVPVAVLRQQFGRSAFTIARAAQGGGDSIVKGLYPPASLSAHLTFCGAPDNSQCLDEGITLLAKRIGKRLAEQESMGHDLVLLMEHEGMERTRRERQFTKPLAGEKEVLVALRLLAAPFPEKPILRIVARLERVVLQKPVQRDLCGVRADADRSAGIKAAITGLQGAFGEKIVLKASELVEPRFLRVRRVWSRATGWSFG
jgi:nucleotidyltransferase/DNA polymerase involved in DNA repair